MDFLYIPILTQHAEELCGDKQKKIHTGRIYNLLIFEVG